MRLIALLFAALSGAIVGFLLATAVYAAPSSAGDASEGSHRLNGAPPLLHAAEGLDSTALAGGAPPSDPPTISGTATWYCGNGSPCTHGYQPSDMVAAIDPSLGIPKGTWLTVRHGSRSVEVRVVDTCACPGRRVIDLTSGAFRRLAPLSAGVIQVELEEVGATATLPATDR